MIFIWIYLIVGILLGVFARTAIFLVATKDEVKFLKDNLYLVDLVIIIATILWPATVISLLYKYKRKRVDDNE